MNGTEAVFALLLRAHGHVARARQAYITAAAADGDGAASEVAGEREGGSVEGVVREGAEEEEGEGAARAAALSLESEIQQIGFTKEEESVLPATLHAQPCALCLVCTACRCG